MLLHEEHTGPTGIGRLTHRLQEALHDERGEAHGQLVCEQDLRVPAECPGEGEHLLLAARQGSAGHRDALVERREQPESLVHVGLGDAEVVPCGEAHNHRLLLSYIAHALLGPDVQGSLGGLSVDEHFTLER